MLVGGNKSRQTLVRCLVAVMVLTLVAVATSLGVVLVKQKTNVTSQALGENANLGSGTAGVIDLEQCYLFARPMTARADGQERIRVSVFVLDGRGQGVPGKRVEISSGSELQIAASDGQTSMLGEAWFEVATTASGNYEIRASVDGERFLRKTTVRFY